MRCNTLGSDFSIVSRPRLSLVHLDQHQHISESALACTWRQHLAHAMAWFSISLDISRHSIPVTFVQVGKYLLLKLKEKDQTVNGRRIVDLDLDLE